jgi:hypothetical protein
VSALLLADASSLLAWIGLISGVIAALVSAFVALRQARVDERLARLKSELDAEVHTRTARFDRDLRAEETLGRYREPLAAAAFDLQSRLYNILRLGFFAKWGDSERSDDGVRTTLFRLAQYFGWSEILRRDIQFLAFPEDSATRRVAELQSKITGCFLTDSYGTAMMIWSDEQRAIGERMIVEEHDKVLCMGYARFREQCDDVLGAWAPRLRAEIEQESAQLRLRDVQHRLCELVETLDQQRVRYTTNLDRA